MSLADKKNEILSLLRHASRRPSLDEEAAWHDIEAAMASACATNSKNPKKEIDDCVYALALVYACYSDALPAYTNCDSPTIFERFVLAVPMPAGFRITQNRIKASIHRLDAKRNPAFARDLKLMTVRKQQIAAGEPSATARSGSQSGISGKPPRAS